ncbi:MAG: flippase [Coriobacteriia bacterium]|nr:flippase [Coriobacteriia bacterium]
MTEQYDRDEDLIQEQTQGALSRSVSLVGARVSTWVLAFIMTVIMPRYLGADGFGRFYTALSLTGVMSILVEFGLDSLVAREVARRKEEAGRYLLGAGIIKVVLWVVASIILGIVVRVIGYPAETQIATLILAISVLFTAIATLLIAILQANDRMRWIAVSTMLEKIIYVVFGVAVLVMGKGVIAIAVVTLVSLVAATVLDFWWFSRLSEGNSLRLGSKSVDVKELFIRALPFFSVLFFGAIYFRLDVVFLSLLASEKAVGIYGAAYRLFQTTYILPEAFLFSFFPLFSRLSPSKGGGLEVAAQKSFDILMLIGLPLAAGTCVLSRELIGTLYGAKEYADSIMIMQVLAVAIALMYANGVFVQLLIATDRQKRLAVTAGVAAALNVASNLVLISVFGALGAAMATVLTELLVIVMNFSFLPPELRRRLRFGATVRIALSAAAMAGVLLLSKGLAKTLIPGVPGFFVLLALVVAGIATYFAAVLVLRAVPADDWAMIRSAIKNLRTS